MDWLETFNPDNFRNKIMKEVEKFVKASVE